MKTFGMRFGSPDAASSGPLDDSLVHFEQASSFSNELGMSTFTALNVIPDEDAHDEGDDTRELQIEDALKLYQNAIRLHARGPSAFSEAEDAYAALFESEIFRYDEEMLQIRQPEVGVQAIDAEEEANDILTTDLLASATGVKAQSDGSLSSLPQILHLAYKNRGQFVLDQLRHQAQAAFQAGSRLSEQLIESGADRALKDFAEALMRDDTDADLWRRTARIADMTGRKRIARLCLEAALDHQGDNISGKQKLHSLGLDNGLAYKQLRDFLESIDDRVSLTQAPLSRLKHKQLAPFLNHKIDPYPFLPQTLDHLCPKESQSHPLVSPPPSRYTLQSVSRTWAALGQVLLRELLMEHQGIFERSMGAGISLSFPGDEAISDPMENHPDSHLRLSAPNASDMAIQSHHPSVGQGGQIPEKSNRESFDVVMGEAVGEPMDGTDTAGKNCPAEREGNSPLVSKKRSSSTAGLQDAGDGGRVRSKRIRARESVAESAVTGIKLATDTPIPHSPLLREHVDVDGQLFNTAESLLKSLGLDSLGDLRSLLDIVTERGESSPDVASETPPDTEVLNVAAADLYSALRSWDVMKGNAFFKADVIEFAHTKKAKQGNSDSIAFGLSTFLELAKRGGRQPVDAVCGPIDQGLAEFASNVNSQWLDVTEVARLWVESILSSTFDETEASASVHGLPTSGASTYLRDVWPEKLKETIVQTLVALDSTLYIKLREACEGITGLSSSAQHRTLGHPLPLSDFQVMDLIETIYELHLDIYGSITNPSSKVDSYVRVAQKDRVDRWAGLMDDLIAVHSRTTTLSLKEDFLSLRYMWASAVFISLSEGVSKEALGHCMTELNMVLRAVGNPAITLLNNAVMPEISATAAGKELSRATTLDFFVGVFQARGIDPVFVIQKLEPILDHQAGLGIELDGEALRMKGVTSPENKNQEEPDGHVSHFNQGEDEIQRLRMAARFVNDGPARLRDFLWELLREAYEAVQYLPKILSCHLRRIEVAMSELTSLDYLKSSRERRQVNLLRWMRLLNDHLIKALTLTVNESSAFECIDYEHLTTSTSAVAKLARLLHISALYEDAEIAESSQSIGTLHQPSTTTPTRAVEKLQDMQIRAWTLLYTMLREGIVQNGSASPNSSEELAQYLYALHSSAGQRGFCGASNRILLKFMNLELLRMTIWKGRNLELLQILYDLYGLRIGNGELPDHRCQPEVIDRRTVVMNLTFISPLFKKVKVKDLSKPEYKAALDKIQDVLGPTRVSGPNSPMMFNLRIYNRFMKTSIHPRDIYNCIRGLCELPGVQIPAGRSAIADTGWYFFLGSTALVRFRSQKRTSAGSRDDLDAAHSFLKLDLQYHLESWETWYRLAQTFDTTIDEDVLWSADKLNNAREQINLLQRSAIHCYTMAVSNAMQQMDSTPEMAKKLSDLYTDFGIRVYASSRPPFNMEPFSVEDFQRPFSGDRVYDDKPHPELSHFNAWRFANHLFDKALVDRPGFWKNHYMKGKCLWKMYNHPNVAQSDSPIVHAMDVICSIIRAIETLPKRKTEKQDPIFEPHYKLVSIVHKLVQKRRLPVDMACKILQDTPYAQKVKPAPDLDAWEPFVLQVLKVLRTADKANWHHRMTARAAHIIYDESENDLPAAVGARHELTQQIFTKTISIQVWKPEFERAGRHFVYTARYSIFFARLLLQLNDNASMEALTKRVRKKVTEFFEHTKVWVQICEAYIKLLRRAGQIPDGHEEVVFKSISHEEFERQTAKLKAWSENSSASDPTLGLLREAVELKKLNSNLTKLVLLDDLIAETFARLYESIVPNLPNDEPEKTPPPPPPPQPLPQQGKRDNSTNRMSLDNLLMSDHNDASKGGEASADVVPPPSPSTARPNLGSSPFPQGPAPSNKPPRSKGITRREILRKAEAVASKSVAHPAAAAAAPSAISAPRMVLNLAPAQATQQEASQQEVDQQLRTDTNTDVAMTSSPEKDKEEGGKETEAAETAEVVMVADSQPTPAPSSSSLSPPPSMHAEEDGTTTTAPAANDEDEDDHGRDETGIDDDHEDDDENDAADDEGSGNGSGDEPSLREG